VSWPAVSSCARCGDSSRDWRGKCSCYLFSRKTLCKCYDFVCLLVLRLLSIRGVASVTALVFFYHVTNAAGTVHTKNTLFMSLLNPHYEGMDIVDLFATAACHHVLRAVDLESGLTQIQFFTRSAVDIQFWNPAGTSKA